MEEKHLELLAEKIRAYIAPGDQERITKAYRFAMNCHQNQKRASGDPYISHPVEVATMLAELRLDADSIIAGLLHDTVEDTHATLEDIHEEFGQDVTDLVNGLTKLSRIEIQSMFQKQAENFRKLVLAISDDLRVLLIKLVDRLHNMRTIQYVRSPEGRRRIALETLEIYAPLAERIGMHAIQEELQNLSFAELNPDAYETIRRRIKYLYAEGKEMVTQAIEDLEHILKEGGVHCMVLGREKRPYSIWHKMQHKNISFEQLSDIIGFRVLVESNADCYQALGLIHNAYIVLPGRFKDYISTPKPNQYQSLHTTVLGPNHRKIEVQIRTHEMHRIAEYGVAAHWEYKNNSPNKEGRKFRWLRGLLEILENATGAEEFLENTKLEMFQDKVYCFTPKGDLIELPKDSTPVDFAYAVHSKVGNHCKGVKINGKLMPLKTKLKSGDQVEILTSPSQQPSPLWERFVITGKARVSIRRYIRTEQRAEFLALGKSLLQQALPSNVSLEDRKLTALLPHFHASTMEDLYFMIGNGHIKAADIIKALSPNPTPFMQPTFQEPLESPKTLTEIQQKLPIQGLIPGMAIHLANCCHPIPGDQIYGWIIPGKGVDIHTNHCEQIAEIDIENQHLIHLSWDVKSKNEVFTARVALVLINKPGSLGITATTIAKNRGNITNIKVVQRTEEFMDLLTDVEVHDTRHLEDVMAALRTCTAVAQVTRDKHV
jgi:GTP diphosphokinase / guanosine-3',5'-bis(diphosphate) 3'-diphosphatase